MKILLSSPLAPARLAIALPLQLPRRTRLWAALGCAALISIAPSAHAAVTEAWVQRYTGPANGNNIARAVAVDGSGNVVVTGNSFNGINDDIYTAKYAPGGALLWEQRHNVLGSVSALAVDGSGNVIVAGSSNGNGSGPDYYTAKYAAADGALLWEQRYNGPANEGDVANAVAVDGSGNVVVTGYSARINFAPDPRDNFVTADYYTAKYAAADGALLWEKRYHGPGSGDNSGKAVALDNSGNVVVTGQSLGGGSYGDYYTARYAAANGALLWEKRYHLPESYDGSANAVAVDGGGNVVVTGNSHNGTDNDYYTAKYAAANGALLWEKRYNGARGANGFDVANAVAVDGSGNVVVTGVSLSLGYGYDYYTAKYAAADGALLWQRRLDNSGTSTGGASAVAVDERGNVVVSGINGTNGDYYTAKYASVDGALLWEKRYHGPANGGQSMGGSRQLALGPNGMVVITGGSNRNPPGGSSAYDYATVVYWENLPALSTAMVSEGVRLRFTGVPDHGYAIERAPAVTGPWNPIATPLAPPNGLIEYVDTNAPAGPAFYRTSVP